MNEPETAPPRRRKKSKSPTARTLEECRKRGWTAQVVEQTIPRTFIKRDLFGVIDIIALTKPDDGLLGIPRTVGIQATSGGTGGGHSHRVTKILAEPRALLWLEAGNALEVWSWALQGARDTRKTWTLRVEPITIAHFTERKDAA